MEEKKGFSLSELKVGVFVIVSTLILAAAIFTIGSQVGLLEDTFVAKTYLNNVSGLKPGDVVLLGGVEVGNVQSVDILGADSLPDTEENRRHLQEVSRLLQREAPLRQLLEAQQGEVDELRRQLDQIVAEQGADSPQALRLSSDLERLTELANDRREDLDRLQSQIAQEQGRLQNIVVYLIIKSEYRDWIRVDSSISLGSVGLLGDKYIEISLGRDPRTPESETETVSGWFRDSSREVVPITGRTQSGFQELITGANDVLANMESLSATLEEVMTKFEEGEGTVGMLVNDPALYNNINQAVLGAGETVQSARRLIDRLSTGEGSVALLIQQRDVYDRILDSVSRVEEVLAKIQSGEGTLGKALNDPSAYDQARQTLENVNQITARMEAGEGTLGKLSTDEQLYVDLRRTLDQMAGFMQDIQDGKGTLGLLAKDERLYENLNQVSAEMVKLLYDFRQNPKKFLSIKLGLF